MKGANAPTKTKHDVFDEVWGAVAVAVRSKQQTNASESFEINFLVP